MGNTESRAQKTAVGPAEDEGVLGCLSMNTGCCRREGLAKVRIRIGWLALVLHSASLHALGSKLIFQLSVVAVRSYVTEGLFHIKHHLCS